MSWTIRRWDLYAPHYDKLIGFEGPRRRSLALAGLRAGERLLVSGCGTGLDLPLVPAGVEVEAVDLSSGMVEQARRKGTAARVRQMDAQRLEYPDGSFDCVLLHLIVAIVPDPLRCLREAARVVKPSGRVMLFDKYFHGTGRPRLVRRVLNPLMRLLATDLNVRTLELAREAGFRVVAEEPALLRGMFRIARLERSDSGRC